MLAAPVAEIAIEAAMTGGSLFLLAGKWFVFFFGLRLLTTGLHQIARPGLHRADHLPHQRSERAEDRERTWLRQYRDGFAWGADDLQRRVGHAG